MGRRPAGVIRREAANARRKDDEAAAIARQRKEARYRALIKCVLIAFVVLIAAVITLRLFLGSKRV